MAIRQRIRHYKNQLDLRPNLKKALYAGAVLGGGIAVAALTKSKLLRVGALGAGLTGAAGAGAWGKAAADRFSAEKQRVGSTLRTGATLAREGAGSLARNLPSEVLVHGIIDLPVNAVEGAMARQIANRTANISRFAGEKIRGWQEVGTMAVAKPVRRLQTRVAGPPTDGGTPMQDLEDALKGMPRTLRTTGSDISWSNALRGYSNLVREIGSATPSEAQLNDILDKTNLTPNVQNRLKLRQMMTQLSIFGSGSGGAFSML